MVRNPTSDDARSIRRDERTAFMRRTARDLSRDTRRGVEQRNVVAQTSLLRPTIRHAHERGAVGEPAADDIVAKLRREPPRSASVRNQILRSRVFP